MAERSGAETVQVAYGTADRQTLASVEWHEDLTARAAVDRSGVLEAHPEIDVQNLVLGIFGRPVPGTQQLRPGDRVEIGRPLIQDPRDMRREAVAGGAVVGAKKTDPQS